MNKKIAFTLLIIFITLSFTFADTNFRVMSYNTLNFAGSSRVPYFITVFHQVQPDIVLCQEIATEEGADSILAALNNAVGGFTASDFVYDSNYNTMLYYKTSIGTLVSQDTILVYPRAISEYVMDINGNPLRLYGCHLKSATGSQNEADRLAAVSALRDHINTLSDGTEFIITGDMNFYTSSEPGYQKFIMDLGDNSRSQDLCTEVGNWHDNESFSSVHTQSTRIESIGGGASGGLDDTFDFIFVRHDLNNGAGIEYISNSFCVFGNDGEHFNQSINEGTNSAVPDSVADALYNASDHLPIYADFSSISSVQSYVILSEYIEGTSYNKAIEVYNGTGAAVDLSAYSLEKDVNGNNEWSNSYTFSGTLAHGEVYVIAHPSATQDILNVADDTHGGVINFNGDDQVRLLKYGTEIDRIGIPGGVNFAQNVTYVRNSSATDPQSGPQDPRTNGEWDEYPVDTFSFLGSHTALQPTITVTSPDGNEEWERGYSYEITWTSSDFSDNVKIELYTQSTTMYTELISSTDNDGLWQWEIPSDQTIGSDYKIRISDAGDGNPFDESDSYFIITGIQTADDLFISEYIEGSSYNKAIELCNATGSTIDLSVYALKIYYNGSNNPQNQTFLSGSLGTNDVYVITHSSANPLLLDTADMIWGGLNFNGNDAVGFYKNDALIDVIGTIGENPGNGWSVAGYTEGTYNQTLVRKLSVVAGTTDWASSAGTNEDDSEWIVYDTDTFEYLGYHDAAIVSAPQNVSISISATTLTISWNEVSGANEYHVYSSYDPYSGFQRDQSGTYDDTSWTTSIQTVKKFYYVTAE